jgi:hypothetical protein
MKAVQMGFTNPTKHGSVNGEIIQKGERIKLVFQHPTRGRQGVIVTPRQAKDMALGILSLLAETDAADMNA